MRTLFHVPPRVFSQQLDFASREVVPPIGIASMIGQIQEVFPEVGVLDAYAERLSREETLRRIEAFRPDVLAVSAFTMMIHDAAAIAADAKARIPGLKVIAGGPHPSKLPEQTLREFPSLDFVAVGEGEALIVDFLTALRDGESTDGIGGLYTLRDGRVVTAGERPAIEDLDSLQFPEWRRFRLDNYNPVSRMPFRKVRQIPVSMNRGCPFSCIFCAKIMGDKVRKRSVARVIEEIERVVLLHGAGQILFTDETFTIDREQVLHLCESMIQHGLHRRISWLCETRTDMVDGELLRMMKRAGCFYIVFGGEATTDDSLDYMRKGASREDLFRALGLCKKHGLRTLTTYIIGFPYHDRRMIREIAESAIKAGGDAALFPILTPLPGTEIARMAEAGDQGLILLTKDWRAYGKQFGRAMETEKMNRRQLERAQLEAYFRFYLRPSKILGLLMLVDFGAALTFLKAGVLDWVSGLRGRSLPRR